MLVRFLVSMYFVLSMNPRLQLWLMEWTNLETKCKFYKQLKR